MTTELVEDKPGPIDVLTPGKVKVLKEMQQFFPYRGAPAGKFGGHYDVLRRLTLSLWRGIGDQKLFEMWLQDWDDKSDWSDLNGGSMVGFAQSLVKSDTGDDGRTVEGGVETGHGERWRFRRGAAATGS